MSKVFNFDLPGVRQFPYVRMTRYGQWTSDRAQAYLASQGSLKYALKEIMQQNGWGKLPGQTPLCLEVEFWFADRLHKSDLDNHGKGFCDAAQHVVFPSDLWVDRIVWSRTLADINRIQAKISTL